MPVGHPITNSSPNASRAFQHVKDFETMESIVWQMLIEEDSEQNCEAGAEAFARALELWYAGETKQIQDPQWAEEHLDDTAKVFEVVSHWIDALNSLDKLGNVRRDVSSENPLPMLDHSVEEGQATIIDLGLIHIESSSGDEQLSLYPLEALRWPAATERREKPDPLRNEHPYYHITQTLPFLAWELVNQLHQPTPSRRRIEHAIHHDVESVIWMVTYVCMRFGGDTVQPWVGGSLASLCSSEVRFGLIEKTYLLLYKPDWLGNIGGRFADVGGFLRTFGLHFKMLWESHEHVSASEVQDFAEKHARYLECAKAEALEESRGSSSKRPYPTRDPKEMEGDLLELQSQARYLDEEPERPSKKRRKDEAGPFGF
ncbi:hypothetical protein FRC04_010042 [Tulasnella sp. 424]|nr:hypothetical protein FRC04_010042 [Tulasnella sp. 424]